MTPTHENADGNRRNLSRRRLLQFTGAATVGAVLRTDIAVSPASAAEAARDPLTRSGWTGLSTPMVSGPAGPLMLAEIGDLTRAQQVPALVGSEDGFALTFIGSSAQAFPQGTYGLSHPDLGSLQLFMVPVGAPGKQISYEAIIDRTVGATPRAVGAAPQRTTGDFGSGPREAAKPVAPKSRIRKLRGRLIGRITRMRFTVGAGSSVVKVDAWLMRGNQVLGVAHRKAAGRNVTLTIRTRRKLRPGRYDVVIALRGHARHVTFERRTLTLR